MIAMRLLCRIAVLSKANNNMIFKDAKINQVLYTFNRANCTVEASKIVSVSPSHLELSQGQTVPNTFSPSPKMVVDIVTEDQKSYTVNDTNELAYTPDSVITCDLKALLKEIESHRMISEEALSKTEYHKDCIAKCTALLSQYDPAQKERQEIDARFTKLETSLQNLTSSITDFINEFKK